MPSNKARSPSPPVRRSVSTDRGAHIRSRIKPEMSENPPVMKLPFPARVPVTVNKSLTSVPSIFPSSGSLQGPHGSRGSLKQENITDVLYSLQRMNVGKIQPDNEQEQFKQVLNVRHGGIRKSKHEGKAKAKHQLSTKIQITSDVSVTLLSDGSSMEDAQRSDASEAENDHIPVGSHAGTIRMMRNLPRSFSKTLKMLNQGID